MLHLEHKIVATDADVLSKAAGLAKSGPVFQTIEKASGREVLRDLEEQCISKYCNYGLALRWKRRDRGTISIEP